MHQILRVLLGVVLFTASASAASANCPCLSSFPAGISPANGVTIGGSTYVYPSSYGLSTCSAHDNGQEPSCVTGSDGLNLPAWCSDSWCYVDRATCNLPATSSSYFPGTELYYSYSTCGSTNTFLTWFEPASGEAASGEAHVLGDIVTVVHDYLVSLSATLEDNEVELRSQTSPCSAPAPPSCPCSTCQYNTEEAVFWTNNSWTLATWNESGTQTGNPLSFDFSTVSLTPRGTPASADGILENCLSGYLENAFLRVAARESSISQRVGYEYAAFQALGNYVQWPAIQWCTDSYDPRFRSWYVSAASGPKDVVIVLDVSGSMRNAGRMDLAKQAAKKLLDTLTDVDYVGLVQFSSSASTALGATTLLPATGSTVASMKQWIDGLSPTGNTNFVAAFDSAYGLLRDSSDYSTGCSKAILFLSDGIPTSWTTDNRRRVKEQGQALGGNFQLFTYALGSGADTSVLKKISCDNSGALWTVADGGNLADAMADYYTFLAPLQRPCQVRWTYYNDWSSGMPLLAACLATFKKDSPTLPTSCGGGTTGCMPELLGVACMDVSLIVTQAQIDSRSDSSSFYNRVRADQTACATITPTAAQLQALRARIQPQYGNAVCAASDMLDADAPGASSCVAGAAGGGGTSNTTGPVSSVSGASSGGSIGAAIGGAVGAFAIAAVVIWWCQRSKQQPLPSHVASTMSSSASSHSSAAARAFPQQSSVNQPVPVVQAQPVQGYYPTPPQAMGVAMGVAVA